MPHARLALSISALLLGFGAVSAHAGSRLDYDPALWVLCKPNVLYDFYRPASASESDRDRAQTELWARSIDLRDESSYRLEGDVEIRRADQRVVRRCCTTTPRAKPGAPRARSSTRTPAC